MRVEELVGQQMRRRREGQDLTQEQVGRSVGDLLGGKAWSRQTVSAAEQGKRAFTAAELVAIAHVLGTSVGRLLTPAPGVDAVELPGGKQISRSDLVAAVLPLLSAESSFDAAQETIGRLAKHLQLVVGSADSMTEELALLTELLLHGTRAESVRRAEFGPTQPVVAAIVTSAEGILVTKRKDGKPPWGFVSGEVRKDPAESPEDAAVREVKEETGLRVRAGEIIGERRHPATGRWMVYVAARPAGSTKVIVGDQDELAEVKWVSLDHAEELLPGMFEPVHAYLINELRGTP